MAKFVTIEDRFWKHVTVTEAPLCWKWNGNTHKFGYGMIKKEAPSRKPTTAHRVSFELHFGEIPVGLGVLHKCDNPSCTNPSHLFLGTQADNNRDMWSKKRGRAANHQGENHNMANLYNNDVQFIREAVITGIKPSHLAFMFNVTKTTIKNIRKRKTWSHL